MKTGRRCKSWTSKQQNGGHLENNNATQKEEVHEISSSQGRKTKHEYSSKMRYHTQIRLSINLKYFLIIDLDTNSSTSTRAYLFQKYFWQTFNYLKENLIERINTIENPIQLFFCTAI